MANTAKQKKKLDPFPSVQPSFAAKVAAYVEKEVETLRARQTVIQEEIERKTKETVTLRETLLVVNGALQGIQHVRAFILGEGELSSTSSDSSATGVS